MMQQHVKAGRVLLKNETQNNCLTPHLRVSNVLILLNQYIRILFHVTLIHFM